MVADLAERAMAAMFDEQFPDNGPFFTQVIKWRADVYDLGYPHGHMNEMPVLMREFLASQLTIRHGHSSLRPLIDD